MTSSPPSSAVPNYDPSDLVWVHGWTQETDAQQLQQNRVRMRLLHQMRRELPLEQTLVDATRTITTRPYTDADAAGFLAVNNRAFEWHPDQGGWTREQLDARMAEAWVDRNGFLLHESTTESDTPTIDGFCWTKVHPATATDVALGEIFVIASDPSTHGTGLGRALTVAGLQFLTHQGLDTAMLYVESTNEAAVGLYKQLGFHVHLSDAAYIDASRVDVDTSQPSNEAE